MDLLNQTLNSFSTLISEEGGSLLDTIFEANIINLTILVGGLFYLLSGVLSESLSERQQKIRGEIQESQQKLKEARDRLIEGRSKLNQALVVTQSIKTDAEKTAASIKSLILTDGKEEILRLTANTKAQIGTIENKVRKQISDYVAILVVERITMELESKFTPNLEKKIIDIIISKLHVPE